MSVGKCAMCKEIQYLVPVWDISGRKLDNRCCAPCARKVNTISGATR